jgi:hypothetical protein
MRDPKSFVEIRVHVLDANGRPADLTRLKAEMTTRPSQGPPTSQALQLMLPHGPGVEAPDGQAVRLGDGRGLRVQVLRPSSPFEIAPGTSAYFKADREWPAGVSEMVAVIRIGSLEGESTAQFRLKA